MYDIRPNATIIEMDVRPKCYDIRAKDIRPNDIRSNVIRLKDNRPKVMLDRR